MANQPFDRTILHPLEKPRAQDPNQLQSIIARTRQFQAEMELMQRQAPNIPLGQIVSGTSYFRGDSLRVVPNSPAGMSVKMTRGLGWQENAADVPTSIGSVELVDDLASMKPIVVPNELVLTGIPAADATNPRYDIVEVKYKRVLGDSSSRQVLDVPTRTFNAGLLNKSLKLALESGDFTVNGSGLINYKTGTAAVSPTEPTVSSGYTKVAVVRVNAGVTSIVENAINDTRRLYLTHNQGMIALRATITSPISSVTLAQLSAPPGVRVVAVGSSVPSAGAAIDFYIFAGAAIGWLCPTAQLCIERTIPANVFGAHIIVSQAVTVDASLQTTLAGANANPASQIAIGQQGWRIQVLGYRATGSAVDNDLSAIATSVPWNLQAVFGY